MRLADQVGSTASPSRGTRDLKWELSGGHEELVTTRSKVMPEELEELGDQLHQWKEGKFRSAWVIGWDSNKDNIMRSKGEGGGAGGVQVQF